MEKDMKYVTTVSIDENTIGGTNALPPGKKFNQIDTKIKRAALGDLGNRPDKFEVSKKQTIKNDSVLKKTSSTSELVSTATAKTDKIKEKECVTTKHTVLLKNVKPRVNTHWKKDEVKKLTRKNSIKTNSVTTVITTNVKPTKTTATKAAYGHSNGRNSNENTKSREEKVPCKAGIEKGQVKNVNPIPILKVKPSNNEKEQKPNLKSFPTVKNLNEIDTQEQQNDGSSEQLHNTEVENRIAKLKQVRNIDLIDEDNIFLVPEYANDIYAYLYSLEKDYIIRENHLSEQIEVTPKMRTILIDWLNELHLQFHLLTETFHMTVWIIDMYLQKVKTTRKQQLQLVGVTALFIATKYEELYPPEAVDLSYMTDNTYTVTEILAMEVKILQALDFNFSRPLPIHFLRRFSRAADATSIHHQAAKYLLELASLEYTLSHFRSSMTAAASLLLSLFLFDYKISDLSEIEKLWTPTLEFYAKYTANELMFLVKKLARILSTAPTSRFKSVFNRYSLEKFDKVATVIQINPNISAKLNTLCEDNEN